MIYVLVYVSVFCDVFVFLVGVHEILGHLDVFFETFDKNVLILEMIRHPIDVIYSWYQRGWGGGRFTNDPRVVGLTYQSKIGIAPLSNLYIEGEYHELEPMDKIIHLIEGNLKHGFEKYQEMSAERQKQILWVVFEEFVTKTNTKTLSTDRKQNLSGLMRFDSSLENIRCSCKSGIWKKCFFCW